MPRLETLLAQPRRAPLRRWLWPVALLLGLLGLAPAPSHAGKLSEDGRAGVVLNVQGTALVRPAGHQRWTPLGPKSVLHPGDLLRTQPRGAHALEVAFKQGKALLGPGTELQIDAKGSPRLLRGELEVVGTPEKPQHVTSAGGLTLDVKGSAWLSAVGRRTTQAEKAPRWVESYRASASDEWMGSLLAKVDGRDVPLAVGYHKVDVEVRDQIARTTVEQSFVNATGERLEGVFYFPLPADASISGFGMWIGGELVEADIVERQRARQIYEDILRRKKDPGLLEWEGGNIFKARIFPIERHSEKRIRIRYTQVLPLEGDTWRYRYGLRSELLRTKPLRELQIAVRVVSTSPIKAVSSPTHEITLHKTGHEATAEFRASEYRPKNDFEVAVTVDPGGEITAIPHRRGDDGYFMLLVKPPAAESGAWTRDLAPEGAPLDVILLTDTSGSMDAAARANQASFLEGLLSLLGPKDRFRLAAFDAGVHWLVKDPTSPTPASIQTTLQSLATRRSLGWTDLDAGIKAALGAASPNSLIVYVGDGVSTTGDADPVATAGRLRQLGQATKGASVHAVAASTKFEAGVLAALAETGGGSVRTLGANPTADAYALLSEVARPSVKDLRVDIQGVRTARVYPRRLPNLPVGAQQVILGRFLPIGEAQEGKVVVTGTLAGKPVKYTAALRLPAGDAGNSFLPRLWGRRHIDALLANGGSAQANEEIVAFSERFGIMTPLTSFLVLEDDADRERYGVARRVRMRDGERFFADARDKATLEQKRDLMRAAGRWRAGLRRNALLEIARLGRDLPFHVAPAAEGFEADDSGLSSVSGFGFTSFGQTVFADKDGDTFFTDRIPSFMDNGLNLERTRVLEAESVVVRSQAGRGWGSNAASESQGPRDFGGFHGPSGGAPPGQREPSDPTPPAASAAMPAPKKSAGRSRKGKRGAPEMESPAGDPAAFDLDEVFEEVEGATRSKRPQSLRRMGRPMAGGGGGAAGYREASINGVISDGLTQGRYGGGWPARYAFTLQHLGFPRVPDAPPVDAAGEDPTWNPDVLALLRSLPRRSAVRGTAHGFHILIQREGLHATRGTPLGASRTEAWLREDTWRIVQSSAGFTEPYETWVYGGERGALARARQLERTRAAKPTDANAWWLPLWDLRTRDVIRAWQRQGYTATFAPVEGRHATIDLTRAHPDERIVRLTIDVAKRVLLETRWFNAHGKTQARLVRSDLVEVAGRWWARKVERFDAADQLVERRSLQIEPVTNATLDKTLKMAARMRDDALRVHGPLPKRHEAKQALHERRAVFLDHLVLAISLGQQQRAKESLAAWTQAAALVGEKPALPYVRTVFLARARRGEAFNTWLSELTPAIESRGGREGCYLASWLAAQASHVLGPTERGALLDRLKGAWVDAGAPYLASLRDLAWQRVRIQAYEQAGKAEVARAMRRALAQAFPFHADLQLRFEQDLWATGQVPKALGHLESILKDREPWTEGERAALYTRLTDRLWQRRELTRLHTRLTEWVASKPRGQQAYWRHLSSLFYQGRVKEADAAVLAGLALRLKDTDEESAWGRLQASVTLALGSGWNFGWQRLEPGFEQPLADLVGFLWRADGKHSTPAASIFQNWRFKHTEAYRTLRASLYADLREGSALASMPLHRLARYMHWLGWQRGAAPDDLWQTTLTGLRARWTAESKARDLRTLEAHVLRLLDARHQREEAIAFVRTAHERAVGETNDERPRLAGMLFQRLLLTPDRDEHENDARITECFSLLPQLLVPANGADQHRVQAAQDVRRLAGRIFRWYHARGLGSAEERAKLSRAATKALGRQARRTARRQVAERVEQAEAGAHALHATWLALERLAYAVEHGTGLDGIVAEASALLAAASQPVPEDEIEHPLERLKRERAAVILSYAATRRNAGPELVAAVLATYEAGDTAALAARANDAASLELLDWRYQTWRLVVARDDATRIERDLRRWIVPASVESRWRIGLGYLLAETGRLEGATAQFEAVHALDELNVSEYAAMADWYLVLGDDTRREAATAQRYSHMNEGQLSSLVWQAENRMRSRQNGVPADFDPTVLPVLKALMQKAQYPGNYWYRIRNMYRSTKDFRLLEGLADGLVGHTRESIYRFLGRFTALAREVHEEATLDEWNDRLTRLATASKHPLDRRALQLAIALVEGRASKVPETDPAHGARGLAALKSAFHEDWQDGERQLMANYLRGLGRVEDPAVKTEQLRQLKALAEHFELGSLRRLRIADAHAQTLWSYKQQERAVDLLASELDSVRHAHDGLVPMTEVRIFDRHVHWLSQLERFAEAERVILREIDQWTLPMRRTRLRGRLYVLYVEALRRGGRVSLGRGNALFEATRVLIERDMLADPAAASPLLSTYTTLHHRAHDARAPAKAGALLERWSRGGFQPLLDRVPLNSTQFARKVSSMIRRLNGPRSGLGYLLHRHATEPQWLERIGHRIWQQDVYHFARWRSEAGSIGELEADLLPIVVAQLESNLKHGGSHASYFWSGKWRWSAKTSTLADGTAAVAELHEGSPEVVVRCASMLRAHLGRGRAAVDLLASAHKRGLLSESSRWTLTRWLRTDGAFAEALPVIDGLLVDRPQSLSYHMHRALVLIGLERREDAKKEWIDTEAAWLAAKRWGESTAARLGTEAAKHGFPALAERWMEDAIRRRQEARGNRGGRDSTLSRYYRSLAVARGKLGKTAKAVNAASSAILSANPRRRSEMQAALGALLDALRAAKSLEGHIETYDGEVAKTGLDAPILRKAFATIFHERLDYDAEVTQLLLARELDAGDGDVHKRLVAAYDAKHDEAGAVDALFGQIRLAPHTLSAYTDLARRYGEAGQPDEAERALTMLVEISPHQAAGHRTLADARAGQKRLPEAVVQWRQAVRTERLDPTGHLGLARALIATEQRVEARTVLQAVIAGSWEARFKGVKQQAADLLVQIKQDRNGSSR